MIQNYAIRMDRILEEIRTNAQRRTGETMAPPRLLLHSCCAPCSSSVLEILREYFLVTVFYYNPNITEESEYFKRKEEQKRLIAAYNGQVERQEYTEMNSTPAAAKIEILEAEHRPEDFRRIARGLEHCPEGGERCLRCYELRLRETARAAAEGGYDYYTTTLTVSPLKNAARLNDIGQTLAEEYGIPFLPSDFKKRDGFKRSVELSDRFGLYRQNYCGCEYSRKQREKKACAVMDGRSGNELRA